jgi:hypothetical protein
MIHRFLESSCENKGKNLVENHDTLRDRPVDYIACLIQNILLIQNQKHSFQRIIW